MDYVRATADNEALAMAGLPSSEDLFASVWASTRNRSPWLLVNLVTAFVATRVIGLFASTIQEVVALATLMPIVASIGGNTGNQTVALMIRGLASDRVTPASIPRVFRKELIVSVANGTIWGGLVGLFAAAIYGEAWLALVMSAAVFLNLMIAAAVGVAVPLTLHRLGRDPAQGSSVLLTFATDSMGFLIFLGWRAWLHESASPGFGPEARTAFSALMYAHGSEAIPQLVAPWHRTEAASRKPPASPASACAPLPGARSRQRAWLSGVSPARAD